MAVKAVGPHVLVVAASDSSGGAGISRDIETIASFGARSALAATAITVQTHAAVGCVSPIEPSLVAEQMEAAFAANRIAAIKIGLIPSRALVVAVATVLRAFTGVPVVLDPVLTASSGGCLTDPDTVGAIANHLCPLCSLVTPNCGELARLSGRAVAANEEELRTQGGILLTAGASAVLAKGGHGGGEMSTDHLLRPGKAPVAFAASRLEATMRGTGCMLSSAIAAGLAHGRDLESSIGSAKAFVYAQLRARAATPDGSNATFAASDELPDACSGSS